MKKLFLLVIAAPFYGATFAQGPVPGSNSPTELWSQMWNPANVYRNSITRNNVGKQLDTVTTSTPIVLATSTISQGKVNSDTVLYFPLSGGEGCRVTFNFGALKAVSGAPNVFFQLQTSIDAVTWISSATDTVTLNPTSLTVATTGQMSTISKKGRYSRMAISTASANAVVFCGFYQAKHEEIEN